MRHMLKPFALLLAALVLAQLLAACGDREPKQYAAAPAPPVSARGNPAQDIDALRRNVPITSEITPLPMATVENFDMTRARAYPMQPPTIPHSIDGYQVDLNSNRCMLCHARSTAAQFQAPPVSVTHYMDRDDQFLAEVSPRRYFCVQCHVTQTNARPLVANGFRDIDEVLRSERVQ
ncbi:nitrate reductase cytochrome c-type subunit [Luteimonas sp. MC1895]|uniref:nitrate reductase cytochrome c-type subunit n=1 Tax=Luteimonas sp. MC1895 TaxID=2819513 RepID=UPI0018F0C3FB|nr:nitrate reductase cytochrome c-type subunit [Luteimonas sp. MC1895]MBJ6980178.1 nitrate reductase cytochrome c-type subunit [Luteimonas sp. MC1895]